MYFISDENYDNKNKESVLRLILIYLASWLFAWSILLLTTEPNGQARSGFLQNFRWHFPHWTWLLHHLQPDVRRHLGLDLEDNNNLRDPDLPAQDFLLHADHHTRERLYYHFDPHVLNGLRSRNDSAEYQHVGWFMGNFLTTLRLSLGDFDFGVLEGDNLDADQHVLFWIIWTVMVVLSSLIFLNFIIAEVSNSYSTINKQINALIYKERASLIQESEDIMS